MIRDQPILVFSAISDITPEYGGVFVRVKNKIKKKINKNDLFYRNIEHNILNSVIQFITHVLVDTDVYYR